MNTFQETTIFMQHQKQLNPLFNENFNSVNSDFFFKIRIF